MLIDSTVGRVMAGSVALVAVWLATPRWASTAERDLHAGLAYLRAGAQSQAASYLKRFCEDGNRSETCQEVSRVLPLLQRPLADDVREYLAATIEASEKLTLRGTPNYLSRIFPVFP
jgi:hypothetical protein